MEKPENFTARYRGARIHLGGATAGRHDYAIGQGTRFTLSLPVVVSAVVRSSARV